MQTFKCELCKKKFDLTFKFYVNFVQHDYCLRCVDLMLKDNLSIDFRDVYNMPNILKIWNNTPEVE